MESSVIVVVFDGPVERAGIPALSARVLERLDDAPPGRVVFDVGAVTLPDAATVEALARLRLVARRRGLDICLSRASPRLVELLALTGLLGVLPVDDGSRLESRRETEQRKELGRVQEERDPGDAVS